MAKSGKYNKADMIEVLRHLEKDLPLPRKYQEHALFGKWQHHRECHIKPDWLLIYQLEPERVILVRTGSHSELFG